MSSSTRKKAIQLWQTDIPEGDPELLAKTLFSFEIHREPNIFRARRILLAL